MTREKALELVTAELQRAETKHPTWPENRLRQAAIVAEEGGEVLKAGLGIIEFEEQLAGIAHHGYEVTLDHNALASMEEELVKEAVQTAAMALRFLVNYRPLYATNQS